MRADTALLWAETPSNPLLKVSDIAALADIAHAGGARLLVDGLRPRCCNSPSRWGRIW